MNPVAQRRYGRRSLAPLLTVAVACCLVFPALSGAQPARRSATSVSIGVVMLTQGVPWFGAVQNGIEAAAKAQHVDLTLTNSNSSATTEAKNVQGLVAKGVQAIVGNFNNATGSVNQAAAAGIPVVLFNSENVNKSDDVKAALATNPTQLGKVAGIAAKKYIAAHMHGRVNILLTTLPGVPEVADRVNGFKSEIKGLRQVHIVNTVAAYPEQNAFNNVRAALVANPKINLIFGWNETATLGILKATQVLHLQGKIPVIGTDIDTVLAKDLQRSAKSGLKVVVTQDPYKMGYDAVVAGVKVAHHQAVPARTYTPIYTLTSANIRKFAKAHPADVVSA